MIILETLLPAGAGILFLAWCGWALTGWLLPAGSLRWVALPWTGYAAFVVLAQVATQAGLDLAQTTALAAGLAAAANGVYLWRARGGVRWPWPDGRRVGAALAAATAGLFLLGILPLLFYGYATIIGENWDGEIYLALAAYLQGHAQSALAAAPPNPLLHILLVPPYSERTHGFSYVQAALGTLTGLPALATLSPALALLRALAVPATYGFFRGAWGWAPRPALLAAGVAGASPFLLWITYNTFGMQVPSFGLLPLAVAATLLTLRAVAAPAPPVSTVRLGGYAALLTAALAVTYHPALTAWAALAGAGGLAVLARSGRRAPRVIAAGLGVAAGLVALSPVAWWLSLHGFLAQYADQTPGLGLTAFTAPTDALGLSLSFRTLLAAGPGQPLLARAVQGYGALVVLGGLIAAALGLLWLAAGARARAWLPLATLGGALVYLALFLRPLDYVYGWFKAQSFVAFVLVGAVVGGAGWLWAQVPTAGRRLPARRVLAGAALALPALALAATLGLLLWQYHWPLRYSADMVGAVHARDYVQPGDGVLISNSRLMPGRLFNGLLAYFLRDSTLYGTFHTANSAWDAARPDGVYPWAVLPRRERPEPYGYRPADEIWANPLLALYRAPSDLRYAANWDARGDYPRVPTATELIWRVGAAAVGADSGAPLPAGEGGGGVLTARTLEFGVATFSAGTMRVQIVGAGPPAETTVVLAPGLQTVTVPVSAPAAVLLQILQAPNPESSPTAGAPGPAVRWLALRAAPPGVAGAPAAGPPLADVLMLAIGGAAQGDRVQTTLARVDTRPAARQADRVVLDIYRAGSGAPADHFGYWSFALSGPAATFSVPLAGGAAGGGPSAAPLSDAALRGPASTGRFSASLTFYRGTAALDTVTDIYTFDARPGVGGRLVITNIALRALPPLFY